MYEALQEINARPAPFEHHTTAELWTDPHISSKMLAYHLDGSVDLSSRRTGFIDRSAAWIVDRFGLTEGKSVADFGCGPGLYTSRFAASGAEVTGIDFSQSSLRHARGEAESNRQTIDYVLADYLSYETSRRFDLITMIMCDFCALGPDLRQGLLETWRSLLKPGGAVLLDAYTLSAFAEREEGASYAPSLMDGFWSSRPYFGFLSTFKYDDERVVLDKYTIVEAARTRVVYNWLQHYDADALTAEIEASGLLVEELLGDVAGGAFDPASSEMAVVARLGQARPR